MLLCRPTRPCTSAETAPGYQAATALATCEPQGLDGAAVGLGGTMKAAVVKRWRNRSEPNAAGAARRNEMAALRWQDVDFQWKSMTIRDKVEGERTIPLTPFVEHLIAVLPRRNGFVFSSLTAKSGRLEEPRNPHNKALTAAALPALSLHGLRRSFGTLSEWVEVPAGIVAQIMGHKPSAIAEKHYIQRELDLLHLWHTKVESWILEQACINFVPDQAGSSLVKLNATALRFRHCKATLNVL